VEQVGPKRFNHKEMGERSEAIIIGKLVYVGYTVLKPYGENQRYDLVIEDADRNFWRVQCKTAWISKDQAYLVFNSVSNHYHYKGGRTTNTRRDYRGQIEYFAVYSPDTDKVYLLSINHVGTGQGTLRLLPPENNQKKGVRWAKDYEL
jgi:hypothetical protein